MALAKYAEEIYLTVDERLYTKFRNKGADNISYYDKYCYSTAEHRKPSYGDYDKPAGGCKQNRRCINGKITSCGRCVGYCSFQEHAGFLTREQQRSVIA